MAPTASRDGSSTSATARSRRSPRSRRASPTSRSPGSAGPKLTPSGVRALAERHGIRPRKALGQHFLIEPALARRIAELAEAGPGSRVLEIGAGLGSLTVALAASGAEVVAVELDRKLLPALAEAVEGAGRVRVLTENALDADWASILGPEPGRWTLAANLPYNVAVPVVMRVLETEARVERLLVMVQREVGERLSAGPGDSQYGAVSVRVAYWAEARVVRRVPRTVFWPEPNVDSVLVLMQRRPPPADVSRAALWRVIEVSFAQRRKTMRGALIRLGYEPAAAHGPLDLCGIDPMARPERLGLADFACLARLLTERGSG